MRDPGSLYSVGSSSVEIPRVSQAAPWAGGGVGGDPPQGRPGPAHMRCPISEGISSDSERFEINHENRGL